MFVQFPRRAVVAVHPDCDNNFSSQNGDIVENWQWQEGSGATTHSTPVLNSSSVPWVVAIRGGRPAWLTFKVNCLISSTYYIITANTAHPIAPETNVRRAEKHRELQTTLKFIYYIVHIIYSFHLLFSPQAAWSEKGWWTTNKF